MLSLSGGRLDHSMLPELLQETGGAALRVCWVNYIGQVSIAAIQCKQVNYIGQVSFAAVQSI